MCRTAVYKHPFFLRHYTGREHLESAGRLHDIYQVLDHTNTDHLLFPSFSPVSQTDLLLNHSLEHVKAVAATATRPAAFLDRDTRTSAVSFEAALLAAGAVIDGMGRLVHKEIDNGFCLVRPPGHHAEKDRSKGFCLFNNVAIAARWAIHCLGFQRILIVDWDVHHGNGTQQSFYKTDQVMYLSLHQHPFYPGTGFLSESGEGTGQGYTVNVPLSSGHGDEEYARIFNQLICPLARSYRPQLILVSCGFDLMADDPIGMMRVTPAGVAYMTRVLCELAEELCAGKILCVLEGGYNHTNMKNGVLAVLSELGGVFQNCDFQDWLTPRFELRLRKSAAHSADVDLAIRHHGRWWDLGG